MWSTGYSASVSEVARPQAGKFPLFKFPANWRHINKNKAQFSRARLGKQTSFLINAINSRPEVTDLDKTDYYDPEAEPIHYEPSPERLVPRHESEVELRAVSVNLARKR